MQNRLVRAAVCLCALPQLLLSQNYLQHNLVSDLPGQADRVDPNLVNPWGLAASPTSPFWVADNHSGVATVYDPSGKPSSLVVRLPADPTGQVFNAYSDSFVVPGGKAAAFLFATEEGRIAAWYPGIQDNAAVTVIDNSAAGAVYKGLALGRTDAGPVLYAANFHARTVEVFTADFSPRGIPGAFEDPALPPGFAPFNVYAQYQRVFVAYARQDAARQDDVAGAGNGYVDVFDRDGKLIRRLVSGGMLNSPWGMAVAPEGFGGFSNALLVGNFGDGKIHGYDPATGGYLGPMQDVAGAPITIDGLWALQFGNGSAAGDVTTLYFTAGTSGPGGPEAHGLFGSIQTAPALAPYSVLNLAGAQREIAPYTWVAIEGMNLSATTRTWRAADLADNRLPMELDGVSVTIDGQPAYLSSISPTRLCVLTPARLRAGDVAVQTRNGGLLSNSVTVRVDALSPALFKQDGAHALATHADDSPVSGANPARPGEVITLYGTGFGPTDPVVADGTVVNIPARLSDKVDVSIGGLPADVLYQGLTGTGLYQFNVRVPDGLTAGDAPVAVASGGFRSPEGVFLAVTAGQFARR